MREVCAQSVENRPKVVWNATEVFQVDESYFFGIGNTEKEVLCVVISMNKGAFLIRIKNSHDQKSFNVDDFSWFWVVGIH